MCIRDSLIKSIISTMDVQVNLENKLLKVHKSTVFWHVKAGRVDISYKSVLKKPYLSWAMKIKRVELLKAHMAIYWKKIVFNGSKVCVCDFLNSRCDLKIWSKRDG